MDKYHDRVLDQAVQNDPEMHFCPTPNCKVVFSAEECKKKFDCPECKKSYCIDCKSKWHEGMTCQENRISNTKLKEDAMFLEHAKTLKMKQCPDCKFWVERNEGCNHMTCRCKNQFCYICGMKWGTTKCDNSTCRGDQPV